MSRRTIAVIVGTRPEAIKMAPVILELRRRPLEFDTRVVATAQHRTMLDQVLEIFDIQPDVDLDLMTDGQTLGGLTARLLTHLEALWSRERPDVVLVQGDTTSSFVASLVAYYLKVPVGHIEAGLRTHDKYAPFPEEMNRRLVDAIADYYFAPTEDARRHLIGEHVPAERILVTGNTAIDALLRTVDRNRQTGFVPEGLDPRMFQRETLVLVTAHRRESFGEGMLNICAALKQIAGSCPRTSIVYPVHPNPNVRGPVRRLLDGVENLHLIDPLDYRTFVDLMTRASVIVTDSGGIQEEAPSLGIPVLVMRDVTERMEAIDAGVAELVGTSTSRIVERTIDLLRRPKQLRAGDNPFGDGHAAERIVQALAAETVPGQVVTQ